MAFAETWLLVLSSLVLGLLTLCYIYVNRRFNFWKRIGVHQLEPSFPFGNIGSVLSFRKHIGATYVDLYNEMKDHKYVGIYQLLTPSLLLKDPEIIKTLLIKDFASFHDRGYAVDEKNDPLSVRLFNLPGQRWKNLRYQLAPTFSSGRLKQMFGTILKYADRLEERVDEMADTGRPLEVKELVTRYTTDVITTCAFGVNGNCLENPDAEFRHHGRELFKPGFFGATIVLFFVAPWVNEIFYFSKMRKGLASFFRGLVADTMAHREKHGVVRKDMLQSMIGLVKNGYKVEDESTGTIYRETVTQDQMAAQLFGFFLAGFETSSSTISFCLFELSKQQELQEKLYQEIAEMLAKNEGKITYEAIMKMEYLDKVFNETLRKYPTVTVLHRVCTIPYQIPGTESVVPAGTLMVVPVQALHHDPKYFPEPERFDPERFSEEVINSRPKYSYMPFGEGPRNCLGMRFGILQTKVALVSLLSKFQFRSSTDTPEVLKYEPTVISLYATTGIHLHVARRKTTQRK